MISLPDYSIRYSRKAKYVRLSICPQKGLEVVLPQNADANCIPKLLAEKSGWINKHLALIPPQITPALPDKIRLQAFDIELDIVYIPQQGETRVRCQRDKNSLVLKGATHDSVLVQAALVLYLKRLASEYLKKHLKHLALLHNYRVNQITIRGQKTRWGSCSSRGNINLNYKLMFLPKAMMEYVLLHELAHTRHLNHSARFWACLESTLTNARLTDRLMKSGHQFIPGWLEFNF